MKNLKRVIVLCTVVIVAGLLIGCSGGSNLVTPDNPGQSGIPPPDDNPPADNQNPPPQGPDGRELLGIWKVTFEEWNQSLMVEPVQGIGEMFADVNPQTIVQFLSSVGVEVDYYHEENRILGLDVSVKNVMQFAGYNIRAVIYSTPEGPELRNPEGWTQLFDNQGGMEINPFKLFSGGIEEGRIGPDEELNAKIVLKLPALETNRSVRVGIDVTWSGNEIDEAYAIENFRYSGMYQDGNPWCDIYVDIPRWEEVVDTVILEAGSVSGELETYMEPFAGDTWHARIKNHFNMPEGPYQVKISATNSTNQYFKLYTYDNIQIEENHGWAVTWGGEYGSAEPGMFGDRARDCVVDEWGNIYVTGMFWGKVDFDPGPGVVECESNGDFDAYISKFDPGGNLVWAVTFGNDELDYGDDMAIDRHGNIYLAGRFLGGIDFDPGPGYEFLEAQKKDAYLVKFTSDGEFQWAISWGGPGNEYAFGLDVDYNGNAYVTGTYETQADFDPGPGTHIRSANDSDIYVVKFDAWGGFEWVYAVGGSDWDFGDGITVDKTGSYVYVTGSFGSGFDFKQGSGSAYRSSEGFWDAFLLKISSNGNFSFVRTWGGDGWDMGFGITFSDFNEVFITGDFQFEVDFDPDTWLDATIDVGWQLSTFIVKYSSNGTFDWVQNLSGADVEYEDNTPPPNWNDPGIGITNDTFGNVYVTGWYEGVAQFPEPWGKQMASNGDRDAFIARFNRNGGCTWGYNFGGPDRDEGFGLAIDNWNNIYCTGFYFGTADFDPGFNEDKHTSNGYDDAFLVKFLDDGTWGGV